MWPYILHYVHAMNGDSHCQSGYQSLEKGWRPTCGAVYGRDLGWTMTCIDMQNCVEWLEKGWEPTCGMVYGLELGSVGIWFALICRTVSSSWRRDGGLHAARCMGLSLVGL